VGGAKQLDDLVLGRIGVLVLVDHDVFELVLKLVEGLRKFFNSSYILISRSSKSIAPFLKQRLA